MQQNNLIKAARIKLTLCVDFGQAVVRKILKIVFEIRSIHDDESRGKFPLSLTPLNY